MFSASRGFLVSALLSGFVWAGATSTAENIDWRRGPDYCCVKVKGADGNLYILRLDQGRAEWELNQTRQAEAFVTKDARQKTF